MTIRQKTAAEIDIMTTCGQILDTVLRQAYTQLEKGASLKDIDAYIAKLIKQAGAEASFLSYHGYPAHSCLSVNDVVVHGIPSAYRLKDGDVIGMDVGVKYDGYHTDAAVTKIIGRSSPEKETLLAVTQHALSVGVEAAAAGNVVGDIGQAIEDFVATQGKFGIIRDLSGHGVGAGLQEPPEILNYATKNNTPLLNNMTLAIEPMISLGDWRVTIDSDNWTVRTQDKSLAAHFETTLVVRDNDPIILVPFPLTLQPVDPR